MVRDREEEGGLCMFVVVGLEGLSSVWVAGGEAEEEPARRSRSSRRRLSFLPGECVRRGILFFLLLLLSFFLEEGKEEGGRTVVALRNAVLNAAALGEVRDLGPVFVWVRGWGEGAAGAVVGGEAVRCRGRLLVGVLLGHCGRVRKAELGIRDCGSRG